MIINFDKYLNEGITDILQPKSDDEILDSLKGMNAFAKIAHIKKYKMPKKFMPSDKEIRDSLKKLNTFRQLYYIAKYKLPLSNMPSDKKIILLIKNHEKDIKNIVKKYIDIDPIDSVFFIRFLHRYDYYSDYEKFILQIADDLVSRSIESGDITKQEYDRLSKSGKINIVYETLGSDIIENITFDLGYRDINIESIQFNSYRIIGEFIDDLMKTSWGKK